MCSKLKRLHLRLTVYFMILLAAVGAVPVMAENSRETLQEPALSLKTMVLVQGSAQIDGKSEFLWEVLKAVSFGSESTKAWAKFLWNKKNLYLYVVVEDKTQNTEDNVTLFLDTFGETVAYTFYRDAREVAGQSCIITENEEGYTVEAAVTLRQNPIPGDTGGIDIRVADTETGELLAWSNSGEAGLPGMGKAVFTKNLKATYCLYATPSIDGEMDAVWRDAVEITPNTWVQGILGPAAKVRTAWDEKNIYVYALVTGKQPDYLWEKDSVEFFLDRRNDKAERIEEDDAHYRIGFDNSLTSSKGTSSKHIQSRVKAIDNGYAVEAAIGWDTVTPAQQALIGFDLQINSDYNRDGTRDSAVTWNDSSALSEKSTAGYGVLQLVKPESLVFIDVHEIAWAREQIEALGLKKIVLPHAGLKYEPMQEITRADFLHYLINTLGLTADATDSFDDIPPDAPYAHAVAVAKKLGITKGVGNNQFLPLLGITRQDMMTLVVRAMDIAGRGYEPADQTVIQGFVDASLVSDYAVQSVSVLVKNEWIQGSNNRLNPKFNLNRAEAAVLLYRIYTNP